MSFNEGQMISFEVMYDDAIDGIDRGCCSVSEFPYIESGNSVLVDPDELITPLTALTLHIRYPLSKPTEVRIESPAGFTRFQFVKAVFNAYTAIYEEEYRSGKYGIWGHSLGDLSLEGAEIDSEGRVHLSIGS
jgi:hypothetical protein